MSYVNDESVKEYDIMKNYDGTRLLVTLGRAAPRVYCQLYETCSAVQCRRAVLRGTSD